jgi:1-deoxy-D-xylulose-5-phosphate reductoisomerase
MSDGDSCKRRGVAVLGSTGSIGTQTLNVIAKHSDKLFCAALAAGTRVEELTKQAKTFGVCNVAVGKESLKDDPRANELRNLIEDSVGCEPGSNRQIAKGSLGFGQDAVINLIYADDVDIVVNSLVGSAGLRISYETLRAGKVLALANKESLVVGGDLIMPLAHALDVAAGTQKYLMPIDSEHGAIYQCLIGEDPNAVAKLWVTASGGPFRGKKTQDLRNVTPAQALAHPTWNMGAKISIDSSTLMNKGLEVIEAHHLFSMPYEKIEVVVQPQSAIHSMVEFIDGSVKAHLGTTDMRIPIQFALSYPDRWESPVAPLDFRTLGSLEFDSPDMETFKCLALARAAGAQGGTLPCVMNAANEVAVAAFLREELSYLGIAECVEAVMDSHTPEQVHSLEQLENWDAWSRRISSEWIAKR